MLTPPFHDLGLTPNMPGIPGTPPAMTDGAGRPEFARALSDLMAGTAPGALAAGSSAARQAPAAPGKDMPGVGKPGPATMLLAAPMADCEMPDPDTLPAIGSHEPAAPVAESDAAAELPDPVLEPALAWLLPPPVTVVQPSPIKAGGPAATVKSALPLLQAPPIGPDCETPADPVAQLPFEAGLAGGKDTVIPQYIARALQTAAEPVRNDRPADVVSATDTTPTLRRNQMRADTPGSNSDDVDLPTIGQRGAVVARSALRPLGEQKTPVTLPVEASLVNGVRRDQAPTFHTGRDTAKGEPAPAMRIELPTIARSAPAVTITLEPAAANAPTFADSIMLAAGGPVAGHAATTAQSPGIDLTRDAGINRMIDRIEHLRDSVDVRETRIRLIPDALGPVDISVRRDGGGDGVQVHFAATEAATRQLIADAQQRLTELADARGVRIERAIIDGGGGQPWGGDDQGRSQPQQARSTPRAPVRADDGTSTETTDERIA